MRWSGQELVCGGVCEDNRLFSGTPLIPLPQKWLGIVPVEMAQAAEHSWLRRMS